MFGVFTYGAYAHCLVSLFGGLFMACAWVRLCGVIWWFGCCFGFRFMTSGGLLCFAALMDFAVGGFW